MGFLGLMHKPLVTEEFDCKNQFKKVSVVIMNADYIYVYVYIYMYVHIWLSMG